MKVKSWPSTGIADKGNLKYWADYSSKNSYHCDQGELKANLDADAGGGPKSRENDSSKDDWKVAKKDQEGRGWTKESETDNTYTGKGGSKRTRHLPSDAEKDGST
jgi:hypothetical protein